MPSKLDFINDYLSPLEQFNMSTFFADNLKFIAPEVYLNWAINFEYMKMVDFETAYFVDPTSFGNWYNKIILGLVILFLIFAIGLLTYVYSSTSIFKFINQFVISSWLATKVALYFMTFNNISFKFLVTSNSNIENDVQAIIYPFNHGGFLLTDVFCFFITAILILYLSASFQNYNSSKGPFIVSKDILTYVQISIHKVTVDLLGSSIDKDMQTQSYHAFIYTLFTYLTISNLQGLVPFTFTVTSHLIATFFLAQVIIMYVTSTILAKQGFKHLLGLFMPSGAPLLLGYLLVPIEFISFFFKTVSLSVRLFANMMAGHTLLKVILGFAWTLLTISEVYFVVNLFPIVILILLTVLEIGVSVIQAYIFSILTCLYLRDAFKGH